MLVGNFRGQTAVLSMLSVNARAQHALPSWVSHLIKQLYRELAVEDPEGL